MNFSSGGSEFTISEPAHLATPTLSVVTDLYWPLQIGGTLVLTTNIMVTQGPYNLVPGRPLYLHYLLQWISLRSEQ